MTDTASLFIDARCRLAEGPFWHPLRQELFWFDIHNRMMFRADAAGEVLGRYEFDRKVSAAAVIDRDTLLVAGAHALIRFGLVTGERQIVAEFEQDHVGNRSNDSRVNPAGGFWVGTMSDAEAGPTGAVYQYRAGRIERLFGNVTVTNSICFSPDGATAYFADTPTNRILKCPLDRETGLPSGEWTLFADVSGHRGSPDGSVVDAEGYLWSARWGGGCVVRHAPDGSIDRIIEVPTPKVTCPAFGGPGLKTLYITTARNDAVSGDGPERGGGIFAIDLDVAGQPEPLLVP
jgi:sugar lactone lactonase YvrE